MDKSKREKVFAAIIIGVVVTNATVFAVQRAIPRDPEVPWRGDPDLSVVDDEYLLQLWDNTVIAYRRAHPTGALVDGLARCSEYTDVPKSKEDQEYLIAALARALGGESINWDEVRVIIVLMLSLIHISEPTRPY